MRNLSYLLFVACISLNANAQIKKNDFIIEAYMGFPKVFLEFDNYSKTIPIDAIGYGMPVSVGARFEYIFHEKWGVVVDGNYEEFGYEYYKTKITHAYDKFGNQSSPFTSETHTFLKLRKIREQVRINYHFVRSEKFDAYAGVGIGFLVQIRDVTNYINDPSLLQYYMKSKYVDSHSKIHGAKLSARLAFGGRYYFTNKIGAMMEIGISGGSILQAGFSFKL